MTKRNLIQKLKLGLAATLVSLTSFNAIAQDYKPKYNNIAYEMLMIEDSIDNTPFNTHPNSKTLDILIDNSKNYIPKKENYTKEEIAKISQNIYSDILKKLPNIKEKRDICYKISLIYLAIGQENNISFYASLLPRKRRHMIVKYIPKNEKSRNIEPTTGEIENLETEKYSDDYYLNKRCLSKESIKKGPWLKNLNEKELLAVAYLERAIKFQDKADPRKALEDCNKAIQLFPNYSDIYWLKGAILEDAKKWMLPKNYEKTENTIQSYTKALKIDPNPKIYLARARHYSYDLKDYTNAIKDYTNALDLIYKKEKCSGFSNLQKIEMDCLVERRIVYEKIGNYENAQKDLEIYLKNLIGPMIKVPNLYNKTN